MKFYSAEMVNRWNGDHTGANQEQYDQEWVVAQDGYDLHYVKLADNLPASVRKFSELVLFNEAVVSLPLTSSRRGDEFTLVVGNAADKMLHVVSYTLEEPLEVKTNQGIGFDPPENAAVWLYDEFDVNDAGLFQHNILFSNGQELTITFKAMHWRECLVQQEA